VSHHVQFSPEALADLFDLYHYISVRDGAERAIGYIGRIEDCCRSLASFPSAASGAKICAPACESLVSNVAL